MSQITTHILDTALGKPAKGVSVSLQQSQGATWATIGQGVTNNDGRISDLLPEELTLEPGTYRMHFEVGAYFNSTSQSIFYPEAHITFNVVDNSHYHIPLLLSPFAYSTYRGS